MTMTVPNSSFHYPPELLNLMVDAIPRLNRSKRDVLLFFRGAGVPDDLLHDLRERLKTSPGDINKFEMARTVLTRLNAKGDIYLRERRLVLRRVVEFTNYDICWDNDRLEAKGLVASIRDVVNQKDSFTKMKQEREREKKARLSERQRASREEQERLLRIHNAKTKLYRLFDPGMNPQRRGKKLESALNCLFDAYGILIHEAFHLVGLEGEGIVEQIDGVIKLAEHLYFVEVKWLDGKVRKKDVSEHLVRLISRAEGRGIIISANGYTKPAIAVAREFLQHKLVTMATLEEIVGVLESEKELADFLSAKIDAALVLKNPYFRA